MLPEIQLLPITWEAVATLATGFFAVGAAWKLGARQTAILESQSRIAEADLKLQLFDRRADCVSRMRELCSVWNENGRLQMEQATALQALLWDIKVLFPAEVVDDFGNLVQSSFTFILKLRRARYYSEQSNEDNKREFLDAAYAAEDEVNDLMPGLLSRLEKHTRIDVWD
ncbi:MAG: hypothetical protein WBA51_06415 [Erythrobacter sp.]